MSRKNFHDILSRYLEGKCTAQEKATVELWYQMLDQEAAGFTREELLSVENRLWDKINQQLKISEPPATVRVPVFFTGKRSILQAAILTGFAVAIGFTLFCSKQKQPDFNVAAANPATICYLNKTASPKPVYLQDGSYVLLKPGSALTYPKQFARQKREVYLTGEAYFLVSKNPKRPFLVYNNNTITQVVGTSFIVKTNNQTEQTEVSVQTGRVIVTENIESNLITSVLNRDKKIVLTPNQKTTYNAVQQQFKTTLVSAPLPVLKQGEKLIQTDFIFNAAPVDSVLKVLQKTYDIEIIATKEVKDATFTGDINEVRLYSKLDLICESVHAAYQISGTRIYIK